MNLGDSAVVLRPRSVSEVADLAFRVCSSLAFGLYARLALLTLLPVFALCLSLHYVWDVAWGYIWLVAILLGPLAEAAFSVAVSQLMFSPDLGPRPVLVLLRKRFFALVGSFFIRLIAVVISVVSMLILTPFAFIRLLFLDEACLLEGLSGSRAYERSHRLVEYRGAGTGFLVVLLLAGIRIGSVIIAEFLADGIIGDLLQFGRPFGWLFSDGGSPASLAGFFLAIPLIATVRFLYYIDTRTRADGWDIQLRFHAIRARAESERKAA